MAGSLAAADGPKPVADDFNSAKAEYTKLKEISPRYTPINPGLASAAFQADRLAINSRTARSLRPAARRS